MRVDRILVLLSLLLPTCLSAQTAHWVIRPEYDSVTKISPALFRVEKEGLFGLMDAEGTPIIQCSYDKQMVVVEDVCLLLSSNYRIRAMYSGDGKLVRQFGEKEIWFADPQYPYYSEGYIAVCDNRGRWTYLDKAGNPISNGFWLKSAAPFIHGHAVVRGYAGDDSFIHITRQGEINKLDNTQFRDNYLFFASSFTLQAGNSSGLQPDVLVSVVVDSGNNVFLRDISGRKVAALGTVTNWDKTSRKMTTDRYTVQFAPNQQIESISAIRGGEKKAYKPLVLKAYQPEGSQSLTSEIGAGGLFNVMVSGTEVLKAQFNEPVTPVSENVFVARKGQCGLMSLNNECKSATRLSQSQIVVEHHVPVNMSAFVDIDPGIDESGYHLVVSHSGKELYNGVPHNGKIAFSFLPDEKTEVKFDVSLSIDAVSYPESVLKADVSFRESFSVKVPDNVKLNEGNAAGTVNLTIVNTSDTPSDAFDVFVDGTKIKSGIRLSPRENVVVQALVAVDIMDLDTVRKTVSIRIKERGCPAYKSTKAINFERNLINNQ